MLQPDHVPCLPDGRAPTVTGGKNKSFLTTRAEAYMNGAFQSPSTAEDLARIPYRESQGGFKRRE